MEKQPFLLVTLAGGEKKLINEKQVVSVELEEQGHAYIRMSNGDDFVVKTPGYDDWENDFHARKD